MTTFAHIKLDGTTVRNFLNEIQEEEVVNIFWKKGPFMNNTTMRTVNISHWPSKDTIMSQGPTDATNKLNERFNTIMGDRGRHHENADGNQQGGTNLERPTRNLEQPRGEKRRTS